MENENLTMPDHSDRDWSEDFPHENGNYSNKCMECKLYFYGHKRRVICKKCFTPNWVELAKRKRPEDTKDNKAWAGAWLEGEMVGYAKCMVDKVLPKKVWESETGALMSDHDYQFLSDDQKAKMTERTNISPPLSVAKEESVDFSKFEGKQLF